MDPAYAGPNVTSVLNQKGGVGKTALAAGAGGALAERGRRVLLVDFDPQGHLTTEALKLSEADPEGPNLAGTLTGESPSSVRNLIVTHSTFDNGGRLDVIPHCVSMFLLVRKLHSVRYPEPRLRKLLQELTTDSYDHVIIDCPPSLDVLTDNALVAANGILIPVQPSNTSLRALHLLIEQVATIEQELELPPRDLYGLVPSVYRRPLASITRYKMAELEQYENSEDGVPPLPILAHLPLTAVVEEAWLHGQPVTSYSPTASIANAFRRVGIYLDVAAGLSPQSDWDDLGPIQKHGTATGVSATVGGQ